MDKNISREKLWQQCNCQLTGFSEYFVGEKPTDSNVNPVLAAHNKNKYICPRQQNEEFIGVDTIY